MAMASKLDLTKGKAEEFSVTSSVAFMHKKADDVILRVQQALGRTHSKKGQYVTIHHGETFSELAFSLEIFVLKVKRIFNEFGNLFVH